MEKSSNDKKTLGNLLNIETSALPNEISPSMYSAAYLLTSLVSTFSDSATCRMTSNAAHIPINHKAAFSRIFHHFLFVSINSNYPTYKYNKKGRKCGETFMLHICLLYLKFARINPKYYGHTFRI